MKDGFQSLAIEPTECVLHFLGPARPNNNTVQINEQMKVLKGQVKFVLTKPAKIHSMTIKFKGICRLKNISKSLSSSAASTTTISMGSAATAASVDHYSHDIPLLPKLKLPLFDKKTILQAGHHVIPWEMDIPNIYPRSLSIKRAEISYKVMVSISLVSNGAAVMKKLILPRRPTATGAMKMTTTTTMTTTATRTATGGCKHSNATLEAEYPITIQRHLLPYKELAPMIESKLYKKTVPGKYHFEVDAPQIICIEQNLVPMAIKYVSILPSQKPVISIKTRLVQTELYRRQCLSNSESDLSFNAFDSDIFDMEKRIDQLNDTKIEQAYTKYIKKTVPAIIHKLPDPKRQQQQQQQATIMNNSSSTWKTPYLVRHAIHPYLSYTLSTPMVSIYHYIEVIFQFGQKYEEIKMKIPIIVASVPTLQQPSAIPSPIMIKYSFEENRRAEYLEYTLESTSASVNQQQQQQHHLHQTWHHSSRSPQQIEATPSTQLIKEKLSQFTSDSSVISGNHQHYKDKNHYSSTKKKATRKDLSSNKISAQQEDQYNMPLDRHATYNPPTLLGHPIASTSGQPRKFASAQDLSMISRTTAEEDDKTTQQSRGSMGRTYEKVEVDEERPRTATPTMRGRVGGDNAELEWSEREGRVQQQPYHMNKKKPWLQPIDVHLANGGKMFGRTLHLTERPLPPVPGIHSSNNFYSRSSDDILVVHRRDEVQQRHPQQSYGYSIRHGVNTRNANNNRLFWQNYNSFRQDESSIHNNPNFFSSSSLSASSTRDDAALLILQSRPPSPVFSPAPGLPATIALRPQHQDQLIRAVEEWFPPLPNDAIGESGVDTAAALQSQAMVISPTVQTIASSAVLSPRIHSIPMNCMMTEHHQQQQQHRRLALSTISSLTHDSLQLLSPSPSITSHLNTTTAITVDHDSSPRTSHIRTTTTTTTTSAAILPKRTRSSSAVDPDMQQYFLRNASMNPTYPPPPVPSKMMTMPHSPSTIQRFNHEQLPPLPSTTTSTSTATPHINSKSSISSSNSSNSCSSTESSHVTTAATTHKGLTASATSTRPLAVADLPSLPRPISRFPKVINKDYKNAEQRVETVNKRHTLIYLEDSDFEDENDDDHDDDREISTTASIAFKNENIPLALNTATLTHIPPRRTSSLAIHYTNNCNNHHIPLRLPATTSTTTNTTTISTTMNDKSTTTTRTEDKTDDHHPSTKKPTLPRLSFGKDFGLSLGLKF